ncbi:unnamed protein product [Fraxinus pennsylvanica]|uniref:Uncharacterized protein n=1 Tax=Fraxinus pennsylvanica TaxID=56036 RepID=A0AAD1Z0H6_9LAMI|nr:unnamed protein product [Fraxinus pennsylvanica]
MRKFLMELKHTYNIQFYLLDQTLLALPPLLSEVFGFCTAAATMLPMAPGGMWWQLAMAPPIRSLSWKQITWHRGFDSAESSVAKDLVAAEDPIEELRAEAKMWERNAQKLMLDLDLSRKEFANQSKKAGRISN